MLILGNQPNYFCRKTPYMGIIRNIFYNEASHINESFPSNHYPRSNENPDSDPGPVFYFVSGLDKLKIPSMNDFPGVRSAEEGGYEDPILDLHTLSYMTLRMNGYMVSNLVMTFWGAQGPEYAMVSDHGPFPQDRIITDPTEASDLAPPFNYSARLNDCSCSDFRIWRYIVSVWIEGGGRRELLGVLAHIIFQPSLLPMPIARACVLGS